MATPSRGRSTQGSPPRNENATLKALPKIVDAVDVYEFLRDSASTNASGVVTILDVGYASNTTIRGVSMTTVMVSARLNTG